MAKVDELLVGTKGKIYAGAAKITDHKDNTLYLFDQKSKNEPYQAEHDELFAAIAKGEYKFADAENGKKHYDCYHGKDGNLFSQVIVGINNQFRH
jgi:hypothetical protein